MDQVIYAWNKWVSCGNLNCKNNLENPREVANCIACPIRKNYNNPKGPCWIPSRYRNEHQSPEAA